MFGVDNGHMDRGITGKFSEGAVSFFPDFFPIMVDQNKF